MLSDSWIKFINMQELNGWISVHPEQLNVHCLKQMPETKQTKYECGVCFVH